MSVPAAYLGVILIWSTTPLAIQWSGDGPGFLFGVALRMLIGLGVLLIASWIVRAPIKWDAASRKIYLISGVSIFLAMTSVYWSAQHMASGWISVVFGLSPIITGMFAGRVLGEDSFGNGRWFGLLLGLGGLAVVFLEGLSLDDDIWMGVLGVTFSTVVHCGAAVWLKKLKPSMPALTVTTGGLLVAVPLFIVSCLIGQDIPDQIDTKSLASIVYLGVFASAVGFPLYYYLLAKISTAKLALITLICPVTGLNIGLWFNNETPSELVWVGTLLILLGLVMYEYPLKPATQKVRDKQEP